MLVFCKHQPSKFEEYTELIDDNNKPYGFKISNGQKFLFDDDGGWMDTNGCYYDSNANPAGWVSLSPDFLHYEIYDSERNFKKEGENYYYTYNIKKFDPFFNLGSKKVEDVQNKTEEPKQKAQREEKGYKRNQKSKSQKKEVQEPKLEQSDSQKPQVPQEEVQVHDRPKRKHEGKRDRNDKRGKKDRKEDDGNDDQKEYILEIEQIDKAVTFETLKSYLVELAQLAHQNIVDIRQQNQDGLQYSKLIVKSALAASRIYRSVRKTQPNEFQLQITC